MFGFISYSHSDDILTITFRLLFRFGLFIRNNYNTISTPSTLAAPPHLYGQRLRERNSCKSIELHQ